MDKETAEAMCVILNSLSHTHAELAVIEDNAGSVHGVYAIYETGDVRYSVKRDIWSVEGLLRFLETRRDYEIRWAIASQEKNRQAP